MIYVYVTYHENNAPTEVKYWRNGFVIKESNYVPDVVKNKIAMCQAAGDDFPGCEVWIDNRNVENGFITYKLSFNNSEIEL